MNADPAVMEHFPGPLSRRQSEELIERIEGGFEAEGLSEVVSFTTPENRRSLAVMERLGMKRDPADDFDHPGLPEGHPLRRHVLYRVRSA